MPRCWSSPRERRIFYFYDTVRASGRRGKQLTFHVGNPAEHRLFLASVLRRSRYYLAYRSRVNEPEQTEGREEISGRFYEGAAAGAVLLGEPPRSAEFDRQFDWTDAVVRLPFDSPGRGRVPGRARPRTPSGWSASGGPTPSRRRSATTGSTGWRRCSPRWGSPPPTRCAPGGIGSPSSPGWPRRAATPGPNVRFRRSPASRPPLSWPTSVDTSSASASAAVRPGRLNRVEVDQPRHAVHRRAVDQEVRCRLARARHLGADPGVPGLERAVGQPGPVAADGGVEAVRPRFVEAVVHRVHPLHVRAEARPSGEVQRDVRPEPTRHRHRIDQVTERRAPGEHEVVGLRVALRRDGGRGKALDPSRHLRRPEPGAVDHAAGTSPATARRLRARARCRRPRARPESTGVPSTTIAPARSASSRSAAMKAWLSTMPVRRRPEARVTAETSGSSVSHLCGSSQPSSHAVGRRRAPDVLQRRQLLLAGGDHQLAQPGVRDSRSRAVRVERVAAPDAEARLPRAGRIVDARVDHLGVPGAGVEPDESLLFDEEHFAAGKRQPPSNRQPHHSGADHGHIDAGRRRVSPIHASASVARSRPCTAVDRAVQVM